ncbi:MAG: FAD-dependent oxidoreductase, partial [bacterium]
KSIAGLVPPEIDRFISETGLYAPEESLGGERISVYGLRCRAIEHLWALNPKEPGEVDLKKIISVTKTDTVLGKEVRRVIALSEGEIPERPTASLPSQPLGNFDLVTPLFSPREAQQEARRCLRCDQPPCEGQCLPRLPILELLTLVAQGKLEQAYLRMRQAEPLCGLTEYLCQTKENYCERHCLSRTLFGAGNEVAVQTVLRTLWEYGRGEFEGRFGSGRRDEAMLRSPRQKVAVVGSGPAGLRAATDLAKLGYGVTIFERREQIGGIPRYETPVFRFPAEEVFQQIEKDLQALSIQTVKGVIIGQDMTPDELKSQNFAAVFVATGLTVPKKLNIHGENLKGVLTSIDLFGQFLKVGAEGLMKKFKGRKGYVIDSGNTAMDTSRLLRRLGAEVVCIYWKDKARAYRKEIAAAEREGVSFLFCSLPVELIGDDQGFVSHVRIVKTSFNVKTGDWEPLPGTETDLPADFCIYAIGAKPDFKLEGLSLNDDSHILVNRETLETFLPTLYAGGDVVERGNISTAIRDGRKAAQSIHRLLRSHTEKP